MATNQSVRDRVKSSRRLEYTMDIILHTSHANEQQSRKTDYVLTCGRPRITSFGGVTERWRELTAMAKEQLNSCHARSSLLAQSSHSNHQRLATT